MSIPLAVIRYLAELDAALKSNSVADRDQIVQQISEHIDAALAEFDEPSDADVAAVLANLGDPLAIAQESSRQTDAPQSGRSQPSIAAAAVRPPIMTRPWVPVVAVIFFLITEVQCVAGLLPMHGLATFQTAAVLAVLLNVWWWASLAIVFISPLFRIRAVLPWAVSLPVMALIVPPVARDLLDSPHAVDAAIGYLVTYGLPIAVAALAILIAVRATRHAQRWSPDAPASSRPA